MKEMMNTFYLKRIDEALGENDINVILDCIGDYYKAWKTDEAENHYYFAYDYLDISQLLGEIAKDGYLTEILERGELYKMLPKNELANIIVENQDLLSPKDFEYFQDYIISTADEMEALKLAGIARADFGKIQDNIIASSNASAIAQLVEFFPNKADIARAYEKLKLLTETKKQQKSKTIKENFEKVQKIYNNTKTRGAISHEK